ncbi:MAG: lamin tail domain-containing protein [Labilithrix sp.]
MNVRRLYLAVALVAGVYACSEATDGLPQYDVIVTPGAAADGGVAEPETPSEKETPPKEFDAATVTTGVVVLNEIGVKDEWIEIVSSGTGDVDVSGWQVADRDKETGEPKLADAVTFPRGTKLKASGYLLVQAGGVDGGKPCPEAPGARCFHAEFGISNKNGETIFLIGDDGGVQGTVVYPPDAASGDGISWGRVPSGDPKGEFVLTTATPGAANR